MFYFGWSVHLLSTCIFKYIAHEFVYGYGIMHHASHVLIFKEHIRASRLDGVNGLPYDYWSGFSFVKHLTQI
jgi:hypothetical protein